MATPRKSASPKKSGGKKGGKSVSASKKAGLTFPVGRCGSMMRKGRYQRRISQGAAVFMAATLEYLTAETLELAAKTIKDKNARITPRAICLAVRHDADLGALLSNVTISRGGVEAQKFEKKEKKAGKKGGKKSGAKKAAKKAKKSKK